ncbi:MAG: protein kinase [Desulfotalea sp.]
MKLIGNYKVLGRLGRGGMATVYKVEDMFTKRILALKVLSPRNDVLVDILGLESLAASFVSEARLMASLSHPNIASVVNSGEHEGLPYIVLEYYPYSLGGIINEGYRVEDESRVLGEEQVCDYLYQTLSGLNRLHSAGIIHRDLKPFNLMVTSDNKIKIIDFGLSRVRGEELVSCIGMQVGSPYYTAPEQKKNAEKADLRADLYSVGVTAFRLLTGRLWDGAEECRAFLSSLPLNWQDFIGKSVCSDPLARFQVAEEMLVSLEKIISNGFSSKSCSCCNGQLVVSQQIRSKSKRILFKNVKRELGLDLFFRPITPFPNQWQITNDFCVENLSSKLIWQRRGAGYTMSWREAINYVSDLNKKNWQNRSDWRLPSLDELSGLLCLGRRAGSICDNGFFASNINWLWSSDTSTKTKSWLVNLQEGYVDRLDRDGEAGVCVVASLD